MGVGEKRSHDELDKSVKQPGVAQPQAGDANAQQGAANNGMLGLPFMLPSAALMAMNSVQNADQSTDDAAAVLAAQQQMAAAAAALAAATATNANGQGDDKSAEQQQLVQQQLQLLQMQQQQLQQMSPSELTTMAAMAHQMALGMVMMPAMMPLMMMNQNGGQASPQASSTTGGQEDSPGRGSSEVGAADSLGMIGQAGDASAMPLMGAAAYGMGNDDTPKRKRGRPPKKDVLNRPKQDGVDKALKQFPLWGYGMPLPFLPGFVPNGTGAAGDQTGATAQDEAALREADNDPNQQGKAGAKKKTRGTGKPRGRPRTRPRPGDIIQRVKPPAIAPANFPGMQEYLVQKLAEWKATQGGAVGSAEDNRVNSFGSTLMPGEHE